MPFPKKSVPGALPGGGRIVETETKKGLDGLDYAIDPPGLYSGTLKRLARSDGEFCRIQHRDQEEPD